MGMILRIASSRIVGQGDIVGRSGYFSLNLSANSVMRGRLDARRTLKSLVADLRLKKNSFDWIQGSTYLTQSEDLGNLFRAIEALKKIEWFRKSVRDIRGYKVENWSNFTDIVKDI